MATTAAVEDAKRVLAEVADVQAHLPADGDAAPSVDQLRAVKRKFVELKDTFLSLQQRDGLMAAVSGPDVFARLGEETENTDEVLNEAKRRNKGLEDESEALTEEMRSHTAKLDKLITGLAPGVTELSGALASLEEEASAVPEVSSVDVRDEGVTHTLESADAVRAVLTKKREAAATLQEEKEKLAAELEENTGALAPLEEEANELEERATKAEAAAFAKANAITSVRSRLTNMSSWYQAMTETVNSLSGVAVKSVEDDGTLELTLLPTEGREMAAVCRDAGLAGLPKSAAHTLTLIFGDISDESGSTLPEEVSLAPEDTPIDDIVEAARSGDRDVRFIVREVVSRVQCYAARAAHVDKLRRRYTTSYAPMASTLTFSLPAGVAVTVRLTHDYPKPTAGLHVIRLDGIGGWRATALRKLRDELNDDHISSAITLADRLQARLEAMEARGEGFGGVPSGAVTRILGKVGAMR